MERSNIIKITLMLFCALFFIELSNYSYLREYLLQESKIISYYISKECGLSNKVMNYVYNKDYELIYDENNGKQIGDIVYYKLEKNYHSFFFLDKKIVIDKSVILGSYL
mgnify:FL=1